jgi:hypothetical protein
MTRHRKRYEPEQIGNATDGLCAKPHVVQGIVPGPYGYEHVRVLTDTCCGNCACGTSLSPNNTTQVYCHYLPTVVIKNVDDRCFAGYQRRIDGRIVNLTEVSDALQWKEEGRQEAP